MLQRQRMIARLAATSMVVALVAACGDDGGNDAPATATPTMEQSPEITDITDDYFADGRYVGKTVTVTGQVTRIMTPTSFVLTGQEFDDDSILVLSAQGADADRWTRVTVTGKVQRFRYTSFDRDYRLPRAADYTEFTGEEFLVADEVIPVRKHPSAAARAAES